MTALRRSLPSILAALALSLAAAHAASVLDVRDANGNPLPGGYLTQNDTAFTLSVLTTQEGLDSLTVHAVTRNSADTEAYVISDTVRTKGDLLYRRVVGFAIGAASGDGRTQASVYDSVAFRWVNPSDTTEVVSKSYPVRPAPKQAKAWFSGKADGGDTVSMFNPTVTTLYIVAEDQVLPAGHGAQATVRTFPAVAGQPADTETVALAAVPGRPGILAAAVTVQASGDAVLGDGKLKLAPGTSLRGTYFDPVDGDSAVADAGYGVPPAEIEAGIRFTDPAGLEIAKDSYYSPAHGRLYLLYRDDWAGGAISTKQAVVTVLNKTGAPLADTETVYLKLDSARRVGATGYWMGELALKDFGPMTAHDGVAAFRGLGQIVARVVSHRSDTSASGPATDTLLSALPEQSGVLSLEDAVPSGSKLSLSTRNVVARLETGNLTTAVDTAWARVRCSESGDTLRVKLVENAAMSGTFQSAPFALRVGSAASDDTLQCKSPDILSVKPGEPLSAKEADYVLEPGIGVLRGALAAELMPRRLGDRIRVGGSGAKGPVSIACFDAIGIFAGWARPAPEAGLWILPPASRGPLAVEVRRRDGSLSRHFLPR